MMNSPFIIKKPDNIVNEILVWHIEGNMHITPQQAAFRHARSTENQITYISLAIEDEPPEREEHTCSTD